MKKKLEFSKSIIVATVFLSIFLFGSWIKVDALDADDKVNIQDATVESFDYPYTGSPIEPEKYVVLKYGDILLKEGQDYTVTRIGDKSLYGNSSAIFVGTIRITGKGDYTGTLEKEYRILPKTEYTLKISRTEMEMAIAGGQRKLNLYTTPSVYMNVVGVKRSWESSNPNVVTVDENGTLTPVSLGTATITAHYNGQDVTCQVSVLKNIRGDVNRDGVVNVKDLMEIMYFVTKRKTPTAEHYEVGDMNNDGSLDIRDTTAIIGIILMR